MPVVGRVRAPRLSAPPTSPAVGEMYYDTGTNKLYWWNGTVWFDATGGGGSSSWVSALSAQRALEPGVSGQVRVGRQLAVADFTAMGLGAPAGLWNLSDLSDASGNGHALTDKSANTALVSGINGLASTAARFTGVNTQVLYCADQGAGDALRIATGSWGCWFRTAAQPAGGLQQCLIGRISNFYGYSLQVMNNPAGQIYLTQGSVNNALLVECGTPDGRGYDMRGITPVADDRWHFAVATFDGALLTLYLDGRFETDAPTAGVSLATLALPFNIGGYGAGPTVGAANPSFALIDEVFVTADVLSLDQIRYLYAAKIPHTLAKPPAAVSLDVRRQRKGAALAPSDFPTAPLRLYNFSTTADQGSNGVPLLPVATKLGSPSSGYASSPRLTGASSGSISVPAAGIPVGSTIILFGYQLGSANVGKSGPEQQAIAGPGITDSQHNTWVQRAGSGAYGMGGSSGIFVFDCQVTTALVSGNVITYTDPSNGGPFIFQFAWFTQCYFDSVSSASFAGTSANGGTITTQPGGGPVLGVFAVYNGANGSPTPSLGSSGQGPGYSAENTTFTSDFSQTPYMVHSLMWEDKIGAGGVAETATGTLNDGGTQRFGATIAYTASLGAMATLAPGADGAQNGAVAFAGSSYLAVTDAGLPSGTAPRSYGCWLKTSTATAQVVLIWGTVSTPAIAGIYVGSGTAGAVSGNSPPDQILGPFVADGLWHFAVCTEDLAAADGVKRKLYLDGKLVGGSTALNPITLGGANHFTIGANNDGAGASKFTGSIDGVFVCGYALTGDQIAALYAKGSQPLATASKDAGDHVEAMDASNVYAIFDTLDSQHLIDLAVGA